LMYVEKGAVGDGWWCWLIASGRRGGSSGGCGCSCRQKVLAAATVPGRGNRAAVGEWEMWWCCWC